MFVKVFTRQKISDNGGDLMQRSGLADPLRGDNWWGLPAKMDRSREAVGNKVRVNRKIWGE